MDWTATVSFQFLEADFVDVPVQVEERGIALWVANA
jgi:hypothetical protein